MPPRENNEDNMENLQKQVDIIYTRAFGDNDMSLHTRLHNVENEIFGIKNQLEIYTPKVDTLTKVVLNPEGEDSLRQDVRDIKKTIESWEFWLKGAAYITGATILTGIIGFAILLIRVYPMLLKLAGTTP